jgi:hypothetical protein
MPLTLQKGQGGLPQFVVVFHHQDLEGDFLHL